MFLHRLCLSLAIFSCLASFESFAEETAPSRAKPKPGPTIQWVNPPSEKQLPLTEGATHSIFQSVLAGQDIGFVVYVPPQYAVDPTKRFPVIYNLHGNGGNELTSLNVIEVLHAQIIAGEIPPVMMVLANGGHSTFYKDSFDGKFPIESIVIEELIPHIDASYRTIASGKGRCIEGFSMGGRGATRLAVKYPEMFCSLFCQAGNVPHLLDSFDSMSQAERAKHLLGPNRGKWEADDVYTLTTRNQDRIEKHLRIQIACGTKDGGHLPSIRDWHQHLVDLGIDHSYLELQGLVHKRTEMIAQLEPIWFDSHLTALRDAGAFKPHETEKKNAKGAALTDGVQVLSDLVYTVTDHGPQTIRRH
jgi:endo-1,4-beta-xylanase